ncbi:carboxymuconolactone decarboxylase family protein, partial [Streptomyces asiaticus]
VYVAMAAVALGGVWVRRTRSCITLTALIAHGHDAELAMHIRAALTNGLTRDEIGEVLLQSAIYCGVPAANSAFAIAQRVFDEIDAGLHSDIDSASHSDTEK